MRVQLRRHHSTIVAYLALFLALGGVSAYAADKITSSEIARNAVRSKHVKNGQIKAPDLGAGAVRNAKLAANAVTGSKVLNGSLKLADLGIKVTKVSVNVPSIGGDACDFVAVTVPGLDSSEGVIAYTNQGWDNRLVISGAESGGPSSSNAVTLRVCNWTGTPISGSGGPVTLLRFS